MPVMSAPGMLLGWMADEVLGDPSRWHPVAGFGRMAGKAEEIWYADSRTRGVVQIAVLAGGLTGVAALADRATRRTPWGALLTATTCWAVLGGRSLRREAEAMDALLASGDLAGARVRVRNLVGRDPSSLTATELARATIESVAENTSDAVVAPLFWGAMAGLPGLVGYRVVNTLDAMIGHRSPRYRRFGWAAARLDDVLNWVPARIAAGLSLALAPLVGGSATAGWRAIRRDAGQHPSPNAGQVEAAFAGVLGVRLGGTNSYAGVVEDRGMLGDGREVEIGDIARAARLAGLVGGAAALLAALLAGLLEEIRRLRGV